MIKQRNLTLTLLLSSALGGCAFSGGEVGTAPVLQQPSEAGTLTLYRDGSLVGLFGTLHITLNDRPLYRLGLNQSYSVQLDPGSYKLGYTIGLNDCGSVVNIKPKQTQQIRLAPNCMMYRQ